MEEKWSFLSSSPGACLGDGGQGRVSMSAGHLEPVQGSTHGGRPRALGSPGDRLRATSAGQLQRSRCPWYFPSQRHMKWFVGEKEGTHAAEVSVKTWAWQTGR